MARIEMQAMDLGKCCPVYCEVYGSGEILDIFGNLLE